MPDEITGRLTVNTKRTPPGRDEPRRYYSFVLAEPVEFMIDATDGKGERAIRRMSFTNGTFAITENFRPAITYIRLKIVGATYDYGFQRNAIHGFYDVATGVLVTDPSIAILGKIRIKNAIKDAKAQRARWGDTALPDLDLV